MDRKGLCDVSTQLFMCLLVLAVFFIVIGVVMSETDKVIDVLLFCNDNGYDGYVDKSVIGNEYYCYKVNNGFYEYSSEVFYDG